MSNFLQSVDRGKLGLNAGLPNGLETLNNYIYGTQEARYYLIGGESGTGKTTIADFMFVFCPYRFMQENPETKINWTYYSFEQSKRSKENSWGSKVIFDKYQVRLPVGYLLSKGKNRVTDQHYKWCMAAAKEIDDMFEHIIIKDSPMTPSQIKNDLIRYGSKHGTWILKPILDAKGIPKKTKDGKSNQQEIIGWTANDPDAKHIFMIDHISYAALEYRTLKENIDTISRSFVVFREKCGWTFVVIQQFNTELASVERQKLKKNALAPQRVDFGDSRYTFQDADVVLGLMNPYKYDMTDFQGYDVEALQGYAIWTFLMKNRHDGPADKAIPMFMDPVAGMFYELPEPLSDVGIQAGFDDPILPFVEMAVEFSDTIIQYS